jgi:hypothetical protein
MFCLNDDHLTSLIIVVDKFCFKNFQLAFHQKPAVLFPVPKRHGWIIFSVYVCMYETNHLAVSLLSENVNNMNNYHQQLPPPLKCQSDWVLKKEHTIFHRKYCWWNFWKPHGKRNLFVLQPGRNEIKKTLLYLHFTDQRISHNKLSEKMLNLPRKSVFCNKQKAGILQKKSKYLLSIFFKAIVVGNFTSVIFTLWMDVFASVKPVIFLKFFPKSTKKFWVLNNGD